MISVKNLTFSYKNYPKEVLKNISFEIKDGTINMLLGLNGSGKTTLIKILVGLLKANQGDVRIDDTPLQEISIKERSRIISYVSQKNIANDDVLIEDYLTFGMINVLDFYETPKEEQIIKVKRISEEFHISHLLNKQLGSVSGGEGQIIAICSAILQDTRIMVLDEPTSALDLTNQDLVLKTLEKIAKENDKTIILSSHNPNHALRLESNVIVLHAGEIKYKGKSNDIVTVDNLRTIYGDSICYSVDLPYQEISFNK